MKNSFLSLIFIGSTILSINGQTISFDGLLKLSKCKDFDCFSDYIMRKGFSFNKTGNDEDGQWYAYSSDEKYEATSNRLVVSSNTVVLEFNKNGTVASSFRTSNKFHYYYLINQFKLRGFKPISTTNLKDGVVVRYESTRYPTLACNVQTENNGPGPTCTSYDIEVIRNESKY